MQTEDLRPRQLDQQIVEKLKAELGELDRDAVIIDGIHLKPSQCYHFDTDPVHVLFNTNCPDSLKEKVQAILLKYTPPDESSAQ
jgi:hypothetical protein